jgi:hypothetical protein
VPDRCVIQERETTVSDNGLSQVELVVKTIAETAVENESTSVILTP